jgi:hypothetical protein
MKNSRENLSQFLVWMRNGIAFCTTWFLILVLGYSYYFNQQTVSINGLIKMVIWITGAVLLFTVFFSCAVIKKWRFISRLTLFMIFISLYESLGFYWFNFFTSSDSVIRWAVFVGIVLVLYLSSITIYLIYSGKQGDVYTKALQEYQEKRKSRDGK